MLKTSSSSAVLEQGEPTVASGSASPVLWRLAKFARPHAAILIAAFACMALLGAATAAYAYLTGPVLRFLLSGGTAGLSSVERFLPTSLRSSLRNVVWWLPAAIVAIGALKGAAYLGQFYWMGLFGQRVAAALRREIFTRLSHLSPTQLAQRMTGDLLSRFSSDVAAVETAANYAVGSYLRDGLQIIALIAVAIWMDWRVALAALLLVPVAAVGVSRIAKFLLQMTRQGQATLGVLAGQVKEGLGSAKMIQAFNAQETEMGRFTSELQTQVRAMALAAWARASIPAAMEVVAAIALAGVLAFASLSESVAPEKLMSLLTALVLIYQPAKDLARVGHFALSAKVSGERIFALLDAISPHGHGAAGVQIAGVRRGVRLEDVWFAYGERLALRGLTVELPVGKLTALVGPSGGGKSTVTSLLLRFDRPARGRILIDDLDIQRATEESVRAQFALVTQEPLLFSTSVMENIRIARPQASAEQVAAAARAAQADAFIRALPRGYNTSIGERGAILSGGQKQRLCLARAILADAPVLVLDEATSHLDPQSEREVQDAIREVLPGRTALVIAHRLAAIAEAHRIHVVEEGRVVESGSHRELLEAGGLYAQLWALQTSAPGTSDLPR